MKILLIGNISSGKSTINRLLICSLSNFSTISIDSVRISYGDGSEEAEDKCKEIFLRSIGDHENEIIEISGIGKLGVNVTKKLRDEKNVLILNPRCSLNEIGARNKSRKWNTPFPHSIENIQAAVDHTKNDFSNGLLQNILDEIPSAVLYSFLNKDKECLKNAMEDILHIVRQRI